MANQQYYKSFEDIETSKEETTNEITLDNLLTAKMARELTNQTILEKVKRMLENDVKPIAKEGLSEYRFSIAKKYEVKMIIKILTDLGYKIEKLGETSEKEYVKMKW